MIQYIYDMIYLTAIG